MVPGAFGTSGKQVQMKRKQKKMSEREMFLKAYERGNAQFWLNRTRPKKKKHYQRSTFSEEKLQDMLHKAAKTGAEEALQRLGLEDKSATKDLDDMRQLVTNWRTLQTEVGRTAIRLITTAIIVFIGAAIWLSVKSKI